jgi:hypothetical protein
LFETFKLFNRFAQFKPSALFAFTTILFRIVISSRRREIFPLLCIHARSLAAARDDKLQSLRQRLVRGKNLCNGTVTI